MPGPVVVVTGSTRGIGRGLAESFLARGCRVVVTGRTDAAVEDAAVALSKRFGREVVLGVPCDVRDAEATQRLWDAAVERFGRVDVWIMNAGLGAPRRPLWEVEPDDLRAVVETNVLGTLVGARVAAKGMLAQGGGRIYGMEGFGSNGQARDGMVAYGASKKAVAYVRKALRRDLGKDAPVKVGVLSPGIVVTDLLVGDYDGRPDEFAKAKRIFNILGDTVETVTPWLADKVLADDKGSRIAWLTGPKAAGRFATAGLRRRDLFADAA